MSKKKKTIIIMSSIFVVLLIVFSITLSLATTANKQMELQEKRVETYKEEQTFTCTSKEAIDDVIEIEKVYLKRGMLITRTNISTWQKSSAKEQTCKHYKNKAEGLNQLTGVTSSVDCNATSGTFTVVYTISEIDKDEVKLKQFDYINTENFFDYQTWINYMKKNYTCIEE